MNRRLLITAATGAATVTPTGTPDAPTWRVEGEFEYVVEDLDAYVQVVFLYFAPEAMISAKRVTRRTFRDPSHLLVEGAYVKVPVGDAWGVAKVVALGRGDDLPVGESGDAVISVLLEQAL